MDLAGIQRDDKAGFSSALVGSDKMDYSFLKDVSLLITMDCWGRVRTASEWHVNGAKMYSKKFYNAVLKKVYEKHGVVVLDHPEGRGG